MIKVVSFAGSARKDSVNKKLARESAEILGQAGVGVTVLDLAEYPLPIYDGDVEEEQGIPENAVKLREIFKAHNALVIASPEYNSSFSPLIKNTIDWVSRPDSNNQDPGLVAFRGKLAVLLAASPGNLGGLRGLVHLRLLLSNIGVVVLPDQLAISNAYQSFDADGRLIDTETRDRLSRVLKQLSEVSVIVG